MPARIVVVASGKESIELADFLLSARGYIALTATNGKVGMQIALLVRPDLILLDTDLIRRDIRMPGMDDHGVVAAIRDQPGLEDTRILAITASTDSGEPQRLAAAGFDGYIQKPIDPATFIEQVETLPPETAKAAGPKRRPAVTSALTRRRSRAASGRRLSARASAIRRSSGAQKARCAAEYPPLPGAQALRASHVQLRPIGVVLVSHPEPSDGRDAA